MRLRRGRRRGRRAQPLRRRLGRLDLPWLYGLWRYARSGIAPHAARREIEALLVDVSRAVEAAGWWMPCDREGFGHRGTWAHADFVHAPRALFALRALYDLTGDGRWLERYRDFDNDEATPFALDWRFLNDLWRPQARIEETVELGNLQRAAWHRRNPRRVYEADHMREPLFAAWTVVLSGNAEILVPAEGIVAAALRHHRWERLYTALFFIAECAYYEGALNGLWDTGGAPAGSAVAAAVAAG